MRALLLDAPGPAETSLRWGECALPEPGPDEVRVAVSAIGLNPSEFMLAEMAMPIWTYPHVLGLDAAGVIDKVGSEVSDWKVGDRVAYHGSLFGQGTMAEYAIAPSAALAQVPAAVTFEQVAALPAAGLTAYQAIERKLPVGALRSVLVYGATGGVGGFAVQLAQRRGLKVIAAIRSVEQAPRVRRLGASSVIDLRQSADMAAAIRAVNDGQLVDAVIDTVSSANATASLSHLAYGGHLVCIQGLPDFTRLQPFSTALSVHEIALGAVYGSAGTREAVADLGRMLGELIQLIGRGELDPMVTEVVPITEVASALGRLKRRELTGKVVARVG